MEKAPAPPRTPVVPESARCPSCGGAMGSRFCGDCGQRAARGRLTLRGVLRRFVGEVTDLDRGLLHTAISLTRRPGKTVRDYVEGRTARYTGPMKYLLIMVALATFASQQNEVPHALAHGFSEGHDGSAGTSEEVAALADTLGRYFNVLLMFGIAFMVFWSRAFFRSARLNTAEHLVFNAYLFAHLCLINVLAIPLGWMGLPPGARDVGVLAAAAVLYAWASLDFFRVRSVGGVLRTAGMLVMTVASYLVGLGLVFAVAAGTLGE